ncbi:MULTISPECIES: LytR C-terminal domain-containing protein [unclassified Duganella]|uniref:LytR C-terminal domain-containing protein n=1 Tax=unclassified Duganella TaxID=2636909 RepID=UPI001314F6FD|nr:MULTISPECIES: LytR C-terminal domain-containing protein [unclassified Duganella]
MKRTLGAACTGALLMACGGMAPAPAPVVEQQTSAVTALEQACLLEPTDASRWEQLGAALEAGGERERAVTMFRQAATLRAHDVRRDYALLREGAAQARAVVDASMPRTEVRKIGAALVEVLRVAASVETAPAAQGVKLEISNGNGVAGAAARLARTLDAEGIKATRLTNVKPFVVPTSRIEYRRDQLLLAQTLAQRLGLALQAQNGKPVYADMRIVLGRDAIKKTVREE